MIKKIIILFILCQNCLGQNSNLFNLFLSALSKTESNDNPKAIGDNNLAIGQFQIHRACWKDSVDFDKSIGGRYEDCFDPEYAKKIVLAYLTRYCSNAVKTNGFETMARTFNGGPKGPNKKATKKYWVKFKLNLIK